MALEREDRIQNRGRFEIGTGSAPLPTCPRAPRVIYRPTIPVIFYPFYRSVFLWCWVQGQHCSQLPCRCCSTRKRAVRWWPWNKTGFISQQLSILRSATLPIKFCGRRCMKLWSSVRTKLCGLSPDRLFLFFVSFFVVFMIFIGTVWIKFRYFCIFACICLHNSERLMSAVPEGFSNGRSENEGLLTNAERSVFYEVRDLPAISRLIALPLTGF